MRVHSRPHFAHQERRREHRDGLQISHGARLAQHAHFGAALRLDRLHCGALFADEERGHVGKHLHVQPRAPLRVLRPGRRLAAEDARNLALRRNDLRDAAKDVHGLHACTHCAPAYIAACLRAGGVCCGYRVVGYRRFVRLLQAGERLAD